MGILLSMFGRSAIYSVEVYMNLAVRADRRNRGTSKPTLQIDDRTTG
jgi:hypothetical protein